MAERIGIKEPTPIADTADVKLPPSEAQLANLDAAIEADRKARVEAATKDLDALLKRHRVTIHFLEVRVNGQTVRQEFAFEPIK